MNLKKSEKIRRAYNPKRLNLIGVYKTEELRGNIEDVDLINSKIQNKKHANILPFNISFVLEQLDRIREIMVTNR